MKLSNWSNGWGGGYDYNGFSLDYIVGQKGNGRQIVISPEEIVRARIILRRKHQFDVCDCSDGVVTYSLENGVYIFDVRERRNPRIKKDYVLRILGEDDEDGRKDAKKIARELRLRTRKI